MIAVLDYRIGNLRSAEKALQHLGADARLVDEPAAASGASGVVLPGVGAFGACARALRASGLDDVARRAIAEGVPFLGVCVGFQLLFDGSDEDPHAVGLGIVPGRVRRLGDGEKLPQMQWNRTDRVAGAPSEMFASFADAPWFYYVHSFAPVPSAAARGAVVATCDYGGEVVAAIEVGSCWGTQFHPEKSGRAGLQLLRSYVRQCDGTTQLT